MLKQRLITAAILIPLVVWAIFSLTSESMAMVLVGVAVVAAWEWAGMLQFKNVVGRGSFSLLVAVATYLLLSGQNELGSLLVLVLGIAVFWWFIATIWVLKYKANSALTVSDKVLGMLVGIAVIVPSCLAMGVLHGYGEQGPFLLFFLILLTSVADSGAYFSGRRWGKHKLAPVVSPGKTIEGAAGALVATVGVACIGAFFFELTWADFVWFLPLCLVTVAVSIVGDLLESLFKRRAGLKDSGRILPGHGGILDRIDSLTAAAPLFALGLVVFGLAK